MALLVASSFASAGDESTVSTEDYGEIFVLEQRTQDLSQFRASVEYAHELSNPYLNIDGVALGLQKSLSRFFWLGLQGTLYRSEQTKLINAVSGELRKSEADLQADPPEYSVHGVLDVIPLAGNLGFFGNHPLEFELDLLLGMGAVAYRSDTVDSLAWMIKPTVYLSRHWSLYAGFGQELESVFSADERLLRLKAGTGLAFRF